MTSIKTVSIRARYTCKQNHDNVHGGKSTWSNSRVSDETGMTTKVEGGIGDADERYVFTCKGYVTVLFRKIKNHVRENVVFACVCMLNEPAEPLKL